MEEATPAVRHPDLYEGCGATSQVTFNGQPLNPCFPMCNHSPTGFSWGYGGSGPAQLAFALAMHRLQNTTHAQRLYQLLKLGIVARLPFNQDWSLTTDQLDEGIRRAEALLLANDER